jgi:hypothetical protein
MGLQQKLLYFTFFLKLRKKGMGKSGTKGLAARVEMKREKSKDCSG